ncbi:class II aldolase/adducin family protein [Geotoga petraea]|jgi:L-fuculose-phosphate aldolase|uniref:Class II aldolase/adducin family protein n=1 Tax=Geotoga petraea TaxID=28234 RepID=A0A1G6MY91_9BACT|nr:class II aldolase/adducin family protein [Geotoga petraea]MDK2946725.1 L-fuculose-phosphate aldolase [Geotoga sp.]TGG87302.1 class II aldolase/adducin family protein [Geotoga petraea]SDC60421.1 L-fuculose-phosphate aldolase [Geotoga petraea]
MKSFLDERLELTNACKKIANDNLVKGTWGNFSIKVKDKIIITPSGYSYELMTPNDLVIINLEGNILEGDRVPSSEWMMHSEIYKKRKDVDIILHTHPKYSSIASVTMDEIPSLIEDSAMILGPYIKVTDYKLPGTRDLAVETVNKIGDNNAVVMRNHGLVTVGNSFNEVISAAHIVEKNIMIYIEALKLGKGIHYINDEDLKMLRDKYFKSYRQK